MRKKIKPLIWLGIVTLFLGLTIAPNVQSNIINKNTNDSIYQSSDLQSFSIDAPINIPSWNIGNYWIYNMDFDFIGHSKNSGDILNVDVIVTNMYTRVDRLDKMDDEEVYVLSLDGDIAGNIKLLNYFDIGTLDADFYGTAYINSNMLAPKLFEFTIDGKLKIADLDFLSVNFYFDMDLTFDQRFDFLGFPIDPEEDEWRVLIEKATLNARVEIDILGPINYVKDYTTSARFTGFMMTKGVETVKVSAGTFESVLLSGNWGDVSRLHYAPEVGFLAKVEEEIKWGGESYIDSNFYLDLVGTNFIINNDPPCKPDKPSGPTEGYVGEEYTYTSKTADEEGDKIYYWFDWGDGTNTGWLGPFSSGSTVSANHRWHQGGMYTVIVKTKDDTGIESSWSDPLSVTIENERPTVTILMDEVLSKDGLDIAPPFGDDLPELYYRVQAVSNIPDDPSVKISEDFNYNTKDGEYSNDHGDWFSSYSWGPEKEHELLVWTRYVILTVKVMEFDGGGGDDLADVSGCDYPDVNGKDDSTPDKRGAIWHGIYDMGSTDPYPLKTYNPNPDDFRDYWVLDDGYYLIRGDDPPDSSVGGEDIFSLEQNDAQAKFALYDDYELPKSSASIVNLPQNLRPGDILQFSGVVVDGSSEYKWEWDFGDETTSNQQNPKHSYSKPGKYTVTLTLTDGLNQKSKDTIQVIVYENQGPRDLRIIGPNKADTGTVETFTFRGVDPEQDKLSYLIDWGDGTDTGWISDIKSGQEILREHSWNQEKTITITFKVKDTYGIENSETHEINIKKTTKNKDFLEKLQYLLILRILMTLLKNNFFL
jgi:hypothetical protein